MASSALVDQLLQSLSFEVEAVPQDNAFNVKNSPNLTPLNVKVRVRKKDVGNAVVRKGVLSVPKPDKPDGPPERVRLASSDQTVMSFNMLMEAEFERKPFRKPKRNFFGLCLGVQGDDDDKYLPSTSVKGKEIDSKSDNGITSAKPLQKNPYDGSSSHSSYMKRDKYFGKCKPGGCLDPPFGEDKYVYQPKHTEGPVPRLALADESKEKKIKSDFLDASPSKSREKEDREGDNILSLYKQKTDVTENDSDSIITYPSELRLHDDKNIKHKKASVSKQTRDSFNEQNSPYFNPPKTRKESSNTGKGQIIKSSLPASGSKLKSEDSSKTHENYHGEAGDEINKGHEDEALQVISIGGATIAGTAIAAAIGHKNDKINPKPYTPSEPSNRTEKKPVDVYENTADNTTGKDSVNAKFPNKEKDTNIRNQFISQEIISDNLGPKEKRGENNVSDETRPRVGKEKINQMVTDVGIALEDKQTIDPGFDKTQKGLSRKSSQPTLVTKDRSLENDVDGRMEKKDDSNKASQKTTPKSLSKDQKSEVVPRNANNVVSETVVSEDVTGKKNVSNKSSLKHSPRSTSKDGISDKLGLEKTIDFADATSTSTAAFPDANDEKNKTFPKIKKGSRENLDQIDKNVTVNDRQNLKNNTDEKKIHGLSEKGSPRTQSLDKVNLVETIEKKDGSIMTTLITTPRSASRDRTPEKNNTDGAIARSDTTSVAGDNFNKDKKPLKIDKDISLSSRESAREHHKIQQRRDSTGSEGVKKQKNISKEASKNATPRSLSREQNSENQTIPDKIENIHPIGKMSQKTTPRSLSLDRASEYNDSKGKRESTSKAFQKPSPRSLSLDRSSEYKNLEGKKDSTGKAFQKPSPRSLSRDRASENNDLEGKIGKRNSIGKPSEKTTPRSLSHEKFFENKNLDAEREQNYSNKASQKNSPKSISREIPNNSSFVTSVSQKSDQQRKRSSSILSERIKKSPKDKNENDAVLGEKTPDPVIADGNVPSAAFVSQDKESLSSKKSRGSTGIVGVLKIGSPNKSSRETSIKFSPLENPEIEESYPSEIDTHKKVPNLDEGQKFGSDLIDVKNTDMDITDRNFDLEPSFITPDADFQIDENFRTDDGLHKNIYNQTYKDSTSISPTDTRFREDFVFDSHKSPQKDSDHFTSSDINTSGFPADGEDHRVNSSKSPVTGISASGSGNDVKSSQLAIDVYFDIEATDVSTERISGNINETDSAKPKSLITDMGESSYLMDVDNFDETQESGKRSKSLSIELEVVVEGLKRKDDEKSIPEEINAEAFKNLNNILLHEKPKDLGDIRKNKDKKIESKEILSNEDQKYSTGDTLRKSDQKTESSEKRLVKSKSEDSIFLNLAFQTYLEDNQTVVRTLDSLKDNDADNVVMVKSLWKGPEMNEITVPIDSGRVMQIQIKRTSVDQMDRISKFSKPLISKFDKVSGKLTSSSSTVSLGKRLSVTLSAFYSQDLVPLQEIIQGLKQDIDDLASQQIKLRERIGSGPGKSKQLNITTCGCLKNTYENLSSF